VCPQAFRPLHSLYHCSAMAKSTAAKRGGRQSGTVSKRGRKNGTQIQGQPEETNPVIDADRPVEKEAVASNQIEDVDIKCVK
jgi:hypothetical protein